jgi:putative hydrolase of the HAD superfamily
MLKKSASGNSVSDRLQEVSDSGQSFPEPEARLCYTPASMMDGIETLIFDLDDTLVVEEASAEAAFIETGELARIRYGIDPRELHRTVRKTCRELWYAFPSHPYCKRVGISSWEGMWAEFTGPDPELIPLRNWAPVYRLESWKTALHIHGVEDPYLAAELGELFPKLRRQKNVLCPDTLPVMERLAGHYALGLITNGASDLQRRKLEGAAIAKYFDQVLFSGDIGIGKPDRKPFEVLLTRLHATAQSSIMIGDRLATDIQGAHNVGMRAVWINRSKEQNDSDIVPDWEIADLSELIRLLPPL